MSLSFKTKQDCLPYLNVSNNNNNNNNNNNKNKKDNYLINVNVATD